MNAIIHTLIVLGGIGLFFGLLLSLAGIKLKTKSNPTLESLKDILPGVNCGGCGHAGCNAFAEEVFTGRAETDGCPVGGTELNYQIANILGVNASLSTRKTAYIKCLGSDKHSLFLFRYQGVKDCRSAVRLVGGGSKGCTYGCLGGGSCIKVCLFDAISIKDGIAVVDNDKCTGCTVCVKSCPKKLIEMVPYHKRFRIGCNARDGSKNVRLNCSVGCIGCRICEKACKSEAVQTEGQLARIFYEKCDGCGICAEKCPRKCIVESLASNGAL
ncbi:MAG: RnfABCDGE type electron transport complex subunit B [Defluviitaleaceae bacterium]|nr:RnfABCDGE type electron transport complex subunit B [Defluviitaleaceae bacterium]